MERKESLLKLFQDLGCTIESDLILEKYLKLCDLYDVDAEKLVELWLTFCVNGNKNIDPTIETLVEMENEVLKKNYEPHDSTVEYDIKLKEDTKDDHFMQTEFVDDDDVLSMYGCAKAESPKQTRASENATIEIDVDIQASGKATKAEDHTFPSTSFAENSAPSSRQNGTPSRGKMLLSGGGRSVTSWKRAGDYDVEVAKSDEPHVPTDARYMYDILSKQGNILTFVCRSLGDRLIKRWSDSGRSGATSDSRFVKYVRSVSQTHFRTFGRVSANKTASTVTLEGCTRRRGVSVADSIGLDFRNAKPYSVFSGQVVAVEAVNPVGDTLYVKEIFAKAYAPPACAPRITSRVNLVVAAGPFTASGNTNYQPLWDLMEKVRSDEPHVLLLVGPFLEYTHPEVQKNLIEDTHQEFFEKIVTRIMESTRTTTQVVLVASNRDAHHEPIYPTPRHTIYNKKLQNFSNLKLMPDPCILDVAGLKIGVTSVDVIKHIGKEEISNITGMDRLGRLADHVLAQTCFYPVYPSSEDLNVDTELWEKYTFFDQQPHVLILPSDMRYFCKVINECVTLNPERMHKHNYARLSVTPAIDSKWSANNISWEIAKV